MTSTLSKAYTHPSTGITHQSTLQQTIEQQLHATQYCTEDECVMKDPHHSISLPRRLLSLTECLGQRARRSKSLAMLRSSSRLRSTAIMFASLRTARQVTAPSCTFLRITLCFSLFPSRLWHDTAACHTTARRLHEASLIKGWDEVSS